MTFPQLTQVTVTIGGVDITSSILPGSLNISAVLSKQVDTLRLTLQPPVMRPEDWQEIIVWDGSTRIFGGFVLTAKDSEGSDLGLDHNVSASDYSVRFATVRVKAEYFNKSDAQILADVFATFLPNEGYDVSSFVTDLKVHEHIRFNRLSITDIINKLAGMSKAEWYVDYDKKLHYRMGDDGEAAPYNLSDTPDFVSSYPYKSIEENRDGSGVVNRVEIVGGLYLSDDVTFYLPGTGLEKRIIIPFRLHAPSNQPTVQMWRNDGGPTTNLCVNPSFENNITDGWTVWQAGSGGVYSWVADSSSGFGTHILRITAGTALVEKYVPFITLAPGEFLTASVSVRTNKVGKAQLGIENMTNGTPASMFASNVTINQWERLSLTFQNTSAICINMAVTISNIHNDSVSDADFDGMMVEKRAWGSQYCDGSLGTGYAWTGTAHNSTSTRVDMPIWTPLMVKAGYIDTLAGSNEVLYYFQEKVIEQLANFPAFQNAVKITAKQEVPLRVRATDAASYGHYGMYFDDVIVDESIVTKEAAKLVARSALAKSAAAARALTINLEQPGLRPGHLVSVKSVLFGVNETFVVQRVTSTIGINGRANYSVSAGTYNPDLIDLMIRLAKDSQPQAAWRDDEVLDSIQDTAEVVSMSEGTPTMTTHSGPYKWGSFKWNFGKWG